MLDFDEILEQKVSDLERGVPLETVLKDLPEEASDLAPLIRLAASVRTIPHPEPLANRVSTQRQQVMAAQANTRPTIGRIPLKARVSKNWFATGAVMAAAGAVAVMLLCVVAAATVWFSGRDMRTARVENVTGQVQVAANPQGTQWKNIEAGYRLGRGDRLRTLGASSATLAFFEGTHTTISANSDLTLTELKGSTGNVLQVKINQTAGETLNTVTPFQGKKQSYFLVQTPTGIASVHGTSFNVKVSQNGQSQFSVNTGEVRVKNDSSEVTLLAGQATSANISGEIESPTYLFNITGAVTAIDEETNLWTVSGVEFEVVDTTVITADKALGASVKVAGRILDDGSRIADSIEPASDENQTAFFTGTLEEKGAEYWTISKTKVKVDANTILDAGLQPGDPVKVTFNILDDNTWLALKIEALVEQPSGVTPTPTVTAVPGAMPSYEFTPDELETQACGENDFFLTGTLKNTASDAKNFAANVELGYLIDRGGEYVSAVELIPTGWSRIDAGQAVTFNIHVTMNADWDALTKAERSDEDTQVKLRIFIVSATNRPDHLNGRLTVTIASGCRDDLTPTPGGTLTPDLTGTPFASPTAATPAPDTNQDGQCTGANPHPTGMKLAQRYGVSYEEIMGWFCQHYGFGEIDLAYSLSRQSGTPVEQIFAMRASGQGWGQIKKSLLDSGNNGPDKDKNKDKNKGKGNNK